MDSALTVQGRVIYALMMREVHTIYGTSRLGYLWALFDTMMGIVIFWGLRTYMGFHPPHGMPIIFFLLAGFSIFSIFRGTVNKCISAVSGNMALLTFPQVTPLDLMLGRMVVLWGKEIVSALILIAVSAAFGVYFHISNFSVLVFTLIITPLLGLGVGLVCHAFNVLFPVTEKIVSIVLRIMFFTSGLFFSISGLPSYLMDYAWWNPMLQLIEICRMSISQGYRAMSYSIFYLVSCTVVSLCFGLLLERYVRRKLR
ncbi:ABC transporter permease [Mailhella massiliensis]|uniref:ABC transporter permease n=1 Tax=Mailhella massiliensis TaxID=1903261 RepID=UPI00097D4FCB|nr:ABC transporter permease [Mailhella massiliensis]